jgi:alpha-glucosidase
MSQSKSFAICLLLLLAVSDPPAVHAQSNPIRVSSPDHQIALDFNVQPGTNKQAAEPDGQLVYAVTFHQKKIFEESALRLELANQAPLGATVHIASQPPVRERTTTACLPARRLRFMTRTTA